MTMESRQDVIHWMILIYEHYLAHLRSDENPPLYAHVDPAELALAIRALSREGFGVTPVLPDENHEL